MIVIIVLKHNLNSDFIRYLNASSTASPYTIHRFSIGVTGSHRSLSNFLCSVVIVKNSNVLNAVVSSEQVRFKQTSETVCIDSRDPDEIWESSRLWGRRLKRE